MQQTTMLPPIYRPAVCKHAAYRLHGKRGNLRMPAKIFYRWPAPVLGELEFSFFSKN